MLRCAVGGERWVVVGVVVMVGVEVVVLVGLAVVVAMAWFLFFSKDIFFFSSKIGGKKKMAPPPKNVARSSEVLTRLWTFSLTIVEPEGSGHKCSGGSLCVS